MDLLCGVITVQKTAPDFIPGYSNCDIYQIYDTVGSRLEGEIEIGDKWNKPISIELKEDEAMSLGEILDHISSVPHEHIEQFPEIYVEPGDMAETIVSQWRTRS